MSYTFEFYFVHGPLSDGKSLLFWCSGSFSYTPLSMRNMVMQAVALAHNLKSMELDKRLANISGMPSRCVVRIVSTPFANAFHNLFHSSIGSEIRMPCGTQLV